VSRIPSDAFSTSACRSGSKSAVHLRLPHTRIIAHLAANSPRTRSPSGRSNRHLPGFALGTAATAIVGQYLGWDAADRRGRRQRVRFFAFAPSTMGVLRSPRTVHRARSSRPRGRRYRHRNCCAFAFAAGMGIHASLSGALRGAGDVRYVLGTFTFTAWGVRVPIAATMVLLLGLTAPFAWLAAVAENWTRAVLILRRFHQGKWKTIRV
jgi:hypothetical protein